MHHTERREAGGAGPGGQGAGPEGEDSGGACPRAGQCLWEEAGCRRCWRVQRGGARATGFGSREAMGDPGREGASWGVYGQCCF